MSEAFTLKYEHMCLLADMMLTLSAWVFRMHFCELCKWPWKLAVLADADARLGLKESVCHELFSKQSCDFDRGFSAKLRHMVGAPQGLLSPAWLLAISNFGPTK